MFYVKTDSKGIIMDVLSYEYPGYEKVMVETLPRDVLGGWHKLEGGQIVEHPELKPLDSDAEITELKNQVADLWEMVLFGGAAE
ncbi:Uncharacterised protein [Lysinibacillus sphaericus]|nr:Uncharacterised protein [Lysinibacillus sphaericus]